MKSITNVFSILALLGAVASGVFFFLNTKDKNQLELNIQSYGTQLAAERATISKQNETLDTNASQLAQISKNLEEARSNITVSTARSNQLKRENKHLTDGFEKINGRVESHHH
jgi:septal ring factor EnvC (AmiA/AmiB activator)